MRSKSWRILVSCATAALVQAAAAQQGPATLSDASVTLPRPTLTCRTLSEIRLWDLAATSSAVLQRTMVEGSCRNLGAGVAVTVTEQATIGGFDYECLQLRPGEECVWAGAVTARVPGR